MSSSIDLFFKAVRKIKNKNLPAAPIFHKNLDQNLKIYLVWPNYTSYRTISTQKSFASINIHLAIIRMYETKKDKKDE